MTRISKKCEMNFRKIKPATWTLFLQILQFLASRNRDMVGCTPALDTSCLLPRGPRWSAPRRRLPQPDGALPYSRVLGLRYSLQRADMLMGSAVGLVAIAIVLGSLFATKWGHNPTPLTGTSAIADLSVDLFVQLYELDSAPVGPKKISGNDRLA